MSDKHEKACDDMNKEQKEYIKKDADEHWEYTRQIAELMYKKAFVHGFKHGLKFKKDGY